MIHNTKVIKLITLIIPNSLKGIILVPIQYWKRQKNIKIIKTRYTNVIFLCLFSYFLWWEFGKSSFWGDVDNFDAERIVYKISGGARIFLKRDENSDFFFFTIPISISIMLLFSQMFWGVYF